MPRNGSGSASLAEPAFIPNTPISSAAVNSDLSDIADMLTGSLARDGQGGMQAVLPLANTGFTYLTDPNTGMRRTAADTQAISAGGVDAVTITSTAVDVVALKVAGSSVFPVPTVQIADKAVTLAKLYHPTATSRLLGSDSNAALVITGAAAAAGLIRLSVASTATFATSQVKTVSDVVGTTEANGTWTITVVDATHIDLQGSTFTNAYVSGGTIGGGVEEISLGVGLTLTGSILTASLALAGAQGLFVFNNVGTPNSIIDITADQAVMTTGTASIYASGVSVSINTSVTGANGMDSGGRPTSGWVNVFLISDGTTTAGLGSLSATAPTMPGAYTFKVRVGTMRTDSSQNFLRTRQVGNTGTYVVTAATNTLNMPAIASGISGNITTPTWTPFAVANFVPPTATMIDLVLSMNTTGGAIAAPNNSYGGNTAVLNAPPLMINGAGTLNQNASVMGRFVLESVNIYYASSSAPPLLLVKGWVDKVNAS
jgi:hypothetical protein